MGFFDTIVNAFSQARTNKQNAQNVKETNEANMYMNQQNLTYAKAMFDKQMAYDYEMWNKQNEYNSAKSQMARLKEAGLNPYVMMDGGSAGTAGSSTAPSYNQPSMLPAQAAQAQPILSNVGDEIGMIQGYKLASAQKDKVQAEASSEWQDANFKRTQQTLEVLQTLSKIHNLDADTKGKVLDNYFGGMTMDSRIKRAELDNDFVQAQTDLLKINKRLEEAKLPYVSREAQARIDNVIQDTALKYQKTLSESTNRAYTRKMIEKASQDIKESIARTLMTNKQAFNIPMLTQKQADEMADIYMENLRNNASILGSDAFIQGREAELIFDQDRYSGIWTRPLERSIKVFKGK